MKALRVTLGLALALALGAGAFALLRPAAFAEAMMRGVAIAGQFQLRQDTVGATTVSSLEATAARGHEGGRPIVLLHGLYSRKEAWLSVANSLSFRRRVVMPDLPGIARPVGGAGNGSIDPREMATLLLTWARTLALNDFHVAGSSYGGAVAAHMADLAPNRVRSVALLGAPYGLVDPADDRIAKASLRERLTIVAPRADRSARWLALLADAPPDPADTRLWRELMPSVRSLRPVLERLRTKVQIVWCRDDAVFPPSGLATLRALPHVDLRVARNCGHALHVEAPARARNYLKFFMWTIERGRWPVSYPPPSDRRFDHEAG